LLGEWLYNPLNLNRLLFYSSSMRNKLSMKHTLLFSNHRRISFVALSITIGLAVAPASAKPRIPQNLGNGLGRLLENLDRRVPLSRLDQQQMMVRDRSGAVLVDIYLKGDVKLGEMKKTIQSLSGVRLTGELASYRRGVLEGYIPLDKLTAVAEMRGVRSVVQVIKPVADVGATTSQGVVQHRVDQLPSFINGRGITVGALSDSYNAAALTVTGAPLTIRAENDVASGDLPGLRNFNNLKPVVVLQDAPEGTTSDFDEGRAMLQIVHDLAPKAKLCFATANGGQVNFANNIRALANPAGRCKADIVVDDILYLDEPMFSDGIVAQAVDEVAAAGIHYFSSAGNRPGTQAFAATLNIVPTAGATAGSNIDLSTVDPALYAGGFHNFRSDGKLDIAQTISLPSNGRLVFQWDDPFDVSEPVLGATLLSTTGEITAQQPIASFPFNGTAGQQIAITADAIPSGSTDLILTLVNPNGQVITAIDTGTSPETLVSFLPVTGAYAIQVSGFEGDVGDFTLEVREAIGTQRVTTDLNVLLFDVDGKFLDALADNNLASGRPIELSAVTGGSDIQLVVARANTPAAIPTPASRFRYIWFTSGYVKEYTDYLSPATYGHNSAKGASGVAAYSPFRPFIPEDFTSPGGGVYPFDANLNRLSTPEVRLKPDLAAMDGANTTFFSADSSRDLDTFPNFFGTSAAAPHAAAIAALVLQAKGGSGTVTPIQMRTILQRSAFPHDLDPFLSRGIAVVPGSNIRVSVVGDPGDEDENFLSLSDPNFFRITYTGNSSISSIALNLSGGNVTGGNVEGSAPGLVFDPRPFNPALATNTGFPFTLGTLSTGIAPSDVTAAFSLPADPPGVEGQFKVLTLSLTPGVLASGKFVSFGVDRDEAKTAFSPPVGNATRGNSADLFGGGVLIPEGTIIPGGVTFTGTLTNGLTFSGVFRNRIGFGYSKLDGFGFIDAKRAVFMPLP
jgi:hypothetical protein